VGDLVVGARSGSGEPEKRDGHVPSVDGTGADGVVPDETADGGAHGAVHGQPAEGGYGGGYEQGREAGYAGRDVGYGNGGGPGYDPGGAYEPGYEPGYDPGLVGAPSTRPEDFGGVGGAGAMSPADGGQGAHRADPDGPGGSGGGGGHGDGGGGPSGEPGHAAERKPRSFWKELPMLIGIALVLALLIKTFLVQAFSIPSDSMQNTLQQGDRVLVDKLTPWFGSTPSRGEVVVFHDPGGWLPENPPPSSDPVVRGLQKSLSFIGLMPSAEEKDLIKRVIGVGGDTVSCKGTGPVVVNGKPLNEPYVFPGNTPCSADKPFTVHVPKGRIWVMGDHRQDSLDSRYHMDKPGGGTVSTKEVVGRAIVVAWPVNRWDWLGIPGTFSQSGINAAGSAVPAAAGLAGAVPLVMLRRRRLLNTYEASEISGGSES
jgi:signal peptidase I